LKPADTPDVVDFPVQRMGTPTQSIAAPSGAGLDLGVLPGLLGYNIRRAQIALWRDFHRNVSKGEVRPGLFSVLVLASANPGVAQIQLARLLAIDKASVVALVDRLEHAGLIARRRSTVDRRRQGIFVTAEGTKRLKVLKREMISHEKRFVDRMTEAELQQLIELLRRLYI
jgi:DNA-binding MarR family transcriptional regulator